MFQGAGRAGGTCKAALSSPEACVDYKRWRLHELLTQLHHLLHHRRHNLCHLDKSSSKAMEAKSRDSEPGDGFLSFAGSGREPLGDPFQACLPRRTAYSGSS